MGPKHDGVIRKKFKKRGANADHAAPFRKSPFGIEERKQGWRNLLALSKAVHSAEAQHQNEYVAI
jgi:hypothetical protein